MITYQGKISRIRMEEEQHKRDLNLKEREYERLMKSEAGARNRVEEIEEALRESTVALESTRGEVEVLRAEMAVCLFIWSRIECRSNNFILESGCAYRRCI